jgi:RNA polymerase sigma-70 factor (ECF subfamily)
METITKKLTAKVVTTNDVHAFEDLYRHYFVRLYRFCFSILHAKEPAEEIVNDVFMNLWKRREAIAEIGNLDLYLYVSVKNLSLNYLRNDHFAHTVDIGERCNNYIQFNADPESLMISSESVKKMLAAIDRLPPRCKLIFSLIRDDGLKYKDVAKLLDLSIKTVESQLGIAMRKIGQAL